MKRIIPANNRRDEMRQGFSKSAMLAAAILAASPAAAQMLTGSDVMTLFADKTLMATLPNGATAELRLARDGTAVATGAINDQGRWWPIDAGYCSQWRGQSEGRERCFTVIRRPDGAFDVINPAGAVASTIRVQ
jgi:hypothetical protein